MSEWVETTLGELFSVKNAKLGEHSKEPAVLSLSKYDGFVRADEYFDKRIASAKLDGYKTVEPGEWAFSTIHIDEGSIARNNLGVRGAISPMYTTMTFHGDACLPTYADLLVRQPDMLAEYSRRAQGSINRRRSLSFRAFAEIAILLPPLAVQKRVVDVIAAVDAQTEAMAKEFAELGSLFLLEVAARTAPDDSAKPLTEVSDNLDSKRVPVSAVERAKRPGSIPYYGAGGQAGTIDAALFDEPLVCLGEDGAGLLNWRSRPIAYRIDGPSWVNNHAHVLRATGVTTDWLTLTLMHYDISDFVNEGTRPKLNKGSLDRIRVRTVDTGSDEQVLMGMLRARESLACELAGLSAFRSAFLTALLTQQVDIPVSYDALLEAAST